MASWSRAAALVVAAFGASLLGCAREARVNSGPSWVGHAGPDGASGVVRRVGNEPFTRTVIEDESRQAAVVVAGLYEVEIGRLAGARVRATGTFARSDELGPHLDASSFEILELDGERPHVGTLERGEMGFRLRTPGGEAVPLAALSEDLEAARGARVWVLLDESGTVTRYGVLRTPEELAELAEAEGADRP